MCCVVCTMSKEKDYYNMGLLKNMALLIKRVQSMIAAQFVQMNKFILSFDFIIFIYLAILLMLYLLVCQLCKEGGGWAAVLLMSYVLVHST